MAEGHGAHSAVPTTYTARITAYIAHVAEEKALHLVVHFLGPVFQTP